MLQRLHEHIKGWVAGVIIAVISLSFVLWGIQYYLEGRSSANAVAKVNGQEIPTRAFNSVFQKMQREYTMKTGKALSESDSQALKDYVLQNLILQALLFQSAKEAGFRVGKSEVDAFITSMPVFQENGRFSPMRYEQLMYANGISSQQFMAETAKQLIVEQLQYGLLNSAFVLPDELHRTYALSEQRRDFRYAIIPSSKFIDKVSITNAMIQRYYDQHKMDFKTPETVSIEYIVLSPREISKAKFTQLSNQLSNLSYTNPTTLNPAALAVNQTIQTTSFFTREGAKEGIAKDPKIVSAAFSDEVLQQGNNSDPVELKNGDIVVLRVKSHQLSQIPVLAAVKEKIKKQLVQKLAQTKAALLAEQMQTSIQNGKSFLALAEENHLNAQEASQIQRTNKNISPSVIQAAFSLTMNKKNNLTTAELLNGDSVLIQLLSVHNADYRRAALEQEQALKKEVITRIGQLNYQLYVLGAQQKAKIKIFSNNS